MKQPRNRKRVGYILVTAIVATLLIAASIGIFGNTLARKAWRSYRLPAAALLLNSGDAALAMEIGNYYFNGPSCVKTPEGEGCYNLELALAAYQKAVSINPNVLWGHYQIARIVFVDAKFDEAIAEINKELEANPENLRSLYVRGLIYGYRLLPGDLELAEADFRRFTLWAPSEWAGYNDLAWILSKAGKHAEAKDQIETAFSRVIPDAEKNPWLWNALGLAELNIGNYAASAAAFERSKELAAATDLNSFRAAYPGNDPRDAVRGFEDFKTAIEKNLTLAKAYAQ